MTNMHLILYSLFHTLELYRQICVVSSMKLNKPALQFSFDDIKRGGLPGEGRGI